MAKTLTVSADTYQFPENRDSPGWGEDVTAWATAVTDVLSNVSGTGDILQTAAAIVNNQASPTDVSGLFFDPGSVRGSVVDYSIYRVTSLDEKVETGTIYLGYKSTANQWDVVVVGSGGSGVSLTITNAGQVQYVSDNMAGTSYSGTIKFRARALTI